MLQGFFFLGTERCGRRSWAVYVQISGCPCLDYSIMTASLLALPQWCQTRFMMPKSNSRNFIFIVSFLSAKGPELAKLMPNYLPPLAHTSPYTSGKKLLPQRRSALRFMTCPNIVRRSLDRFLRPLHKAEAVVSMLFSVIVSTRPVSRLFHAQTLGAELLG